MAWSLEEEEGSFSSAKVEGICGGLTDVFKAYANTMSVNGNEPDIIIIDQASASTADARRSSSLFYSFMNSDDENEEKSTCVSRKADLFLLHWWLGRRCMQDRSKTCIIVEEDIYIYIYYILIGVTNWATEVRNFISHHGKDSSELLGNTSNNCFSGMTLLFCSTYLYWHQKLTEIWNRAENMCCKE